MSEVSASVAIEASLADVWEWHFDPAGWPIWADGFGTVVSSEGYPEKGGRLRWRSTPAGRGEVSVPAHIRTISATVSSGGNPLSCNTIPTRGRTVRRSECGSRPRTRTVPDVAGASPSTTSSREVFPAPLVPSNANSSPRRTEKLTSRTASNPRPPPL